LEDDRFPVTGDGMTCSSYHNFLMSTNPPEFKSKSNLEYGQAPIPADLPEQYGRACWHVALPNGGGGIAKGGGEMQILLRQPGGKP
jgi:hypothetical protein